MHPNIEWILKYSVHGVIQQVRNYINDVPLRRN